MVKGVAPVFEGRVRYVGNMRVAFEGRVYDCDRILVACGGKAREVWPSANVSSDPIVATARTLEVTDYRNDGDTASAFIRYVNTGGNLQYTISTSPLPSGSNSLALERVFNPPAGGAGEYLVRMVTDTGTINGPTGWQDAYSEPEWNVEETVVQTTETASGTLTVAQDDGGGSPVPGTEVSYTVNFTAAVVGSSTNPGFSFTTQPWDLEDVTSEEEAGVAVRAYRPPLGSEGIIYGYEGLPFQTANISEQENYAEPPQGDELVRLVAVSGDTGQITGDSLSTWYTLQWSTGNFNRQWELRAPNDGDDYTAVVDLEIDDGDGGIVTKRITMRSARNDQTATDSEIDFTGGPYSHSDTSSIGNLAQLKLNVRPNGRIEYTGLTSGAAFGFPIDWNDSAPTPPDPENFLVRLRVLSGGVPNGSGNPATNQWHSLQFAREWSREVIADPVQQFSNFSWAVDIKKVGESNANASTVLFNGTVSSEGGSPTPGPGGPPIGPDDP